MKDQVYLVCDEWGVTNLRKKKPDLKGGEIAVQINVTVPVAWFRRSTPSIDIIVGDPPAPYVEVEYGPVFESLQIEDKAG